MRKRMKNKRKKKNKSKKKHKNEKECNIFFTIFHL